MNQVELSERLWDFAARVGPVIDSLPDTRLGRHVAGQLVRSSTSAAPNYDESGAAESRNDFIHKLSIALKELRETRGWLRFIVSAKLLPRERLAVLIDECEQLGRILGKSLQTLRATQESKSPIKDFELKITDSESSAISPHGFAGLDHLAIAVPSTEEALKIWRDQLGFPVVCSEVVNGGVVRLTHLDLGNTTLQLVEPLTPDHPLQAWLKQNGPGLHHFCFKVDDVGVARTVLQSAGLAGDAAPHQGTLGKRALFLTKSATQGVQVEVTGA